MTSARRATATGLFVQLAFGLASCGGEVDDTARPGASGIPGPTRLSELSPQEARRLCEWQKALLSDDNCRQNAVIAGGFEAQISDDSVSVDAARAICRSEFEQCLEQRRKESDLEECVRRMPEDFRNCNTTVADAEKCALDWSKLYRVQPSCDTLTLESFRLVLYQASPESCNLPCE